MKILVTGRGGAGSWEIRGRQIGAAIGAIVTPMATLDDMRAADVILAVKRVPDTMLVDLNRCGKPWVYDIVDAYPQPECSNWNRSQSVTWLKDRIDKFRPNRVIWPNARMRIDADSDGPAVYHHANPLLTVSPIQDRILTIGYEGSVNYLDGWWPAIDAECRRLNASFVVNPPNLSCLDVVLALRGGKWNGYAQRRWKSNVKLANAHAAGVPFIGMREDGYMETATGHEVFVDAPEDLRRAFELIESFEVRCKIHSAFVAHTRTLQTAASETLCALKF